MGARPRHDRLGQGKLGVEMKRSPCETPRAFGVAPRHGVGRCEKTDTSVVGGLSQEPVETLGNTVEPATLQGDGNQTQTGVEERLASFGSAQVRHR